MRNILFFAVIFSIATVLSARSIIGESQAVNMTETKSESTGQKPDYSDNAAITTDIETVWATQKNLITISGDLLPIHPIFGYVSLHYETAFNNLSGLNFGIGYHYNSDDVYSDRLHLGKKTTTTLTGEIQYNFYFQNHAPNGFFIGPHLDIFYKIYAYKFYDSSWQSVEVAGWGSSGGNNSFSVGFGGQTGYRWIWGNGIAAALVANYTPSGGLMPGIGSYFGAEIGYAF